MIYQSVNVKSGLNICLVGLSTKWLNNRSYSLYNRSYSPCFCMSHGESIKFEGIIVMLKLIVERDQMPSSTHRKNEFLVFY